jgi:DNA (cytosine-5)-methyltransferase 1
MNSRHQAISLFSGCGGDTLGLERAGFKVLAYNEFNKAAIKTHEANFPNSKAIVEPQSKSADIKNVPDEEFAKYAGQADVVFAGFPCFVAGTPVLTGAGYKPIESVSLDDTLITHTGKIQTIANLQRKSYTGPLYEIRLKYHPEIISSTEEHPYYVRTRRQTWNNTLRKYEYSYDTPIWKRANELTDSDFFSMVINSESKVPTFTVERKIDQSPSEILSVTLNKKEQWYLLGYFVGNERAHDTKKNILWHTICMKFGKYPYEMMIPEWVHDAPVEYLQEFVNGYTKTNGCMLSDGRMRIVTVSENLALGLQRILLKLGHIFGVTKTVRPKETVIQGRVVSQMDTYAVEGIFEKKRRGPGFIEENYAWFPSTAIVVRTVVDESVYNFEVTQDNSYIVMNTIVHNCQGFSRAGKKQATDPRNQMFRQFVRVVKHVRPRFFIGENVVGLITMKSGPSEDDPLMLDLIRTAFREIGYEMTQQVLEAVNYGVPQKRKRILLVGWDTTRVTNMEPASFWASVNAYGASKTMPTLRSFVTNSMEGAFQLAPASVPEGFEQYSLPVSQSAVPTGVPHPFIVLKAGEMLLSCTKRDSPIHSEIVNVDAPSKTIICTYDHQPRLLVGLRKPDGTSYARCLLPDELKQIQGFPAEFKLEGNKKEQVVQVGNAVPPALVESVATGIAKLLVPRIKKITVKPSL